MKKNSKVPPRTVLGRSREFLNLAAKLGQKEISKKVKSVLNGDNPVSRLKAQVEQAQTLVQSLGRLKGAAMKVGQLLSIEAKDFLPPEVLSVLASLQDSAPAMSEQSIREILQTELGPKFNELSDLSPEPIAAASIGQVHKASYQDQTIALKIQYPGIAASIDSDLKVLRNIVSSLLVLGRRKVPLDNLFSELQSVLVREVDYINEAKETRFFGELLNDNPSYRVPCVITELSTRHVLAMSFEPGLKLQAFLATQPTQELRDHFGMLVLDLYVIEFFKAHRVQTDPNFANFFFRPQERQLVLLDFGATREYDPVFIKDYRLLLHLIRDGSLVDLLEHACNKMNLLNIDESQSCKDAFVAMLKASVEPFDPALQPFDFGNVEYAQRVRDKSQEFVQQVRLSAPPHQLIFLHRKLGGIFSMLKTMNVKLDLLPYWKKLVSV